MFCNLVLNQEKIIVIHHSWILIRKYCIIPSIIVKCWVIYWTMLCFFWPHTTTYANINQFRTQHRMGLGGLSLPTLKSFDHWRVMISCLSQRETFMRDLFIKTHEHQIYTLCTTTMMMDMALILFKWSRWMMTFISLVKCCSNIIEYSSTQKGPRKVFSPSEIVGIIMFFCKE